MRKGIGIILFLILFFQASTGIFGATNILDNFNDTITNEWGMYGYIWNDGGNGIPGVLSSYYHSEYDNNPIILGHSLHLYASGWIDPVDYDGFGMGIFFTNKAKWSWDEDWSGYTNLRFWVYNNQYTAWWSAGTSDKIEVQIIDSDNTKVQWGSQPHSGAEPYRWPGGISAWATFTLKFEVGPGIPDYNDANYRANNQNGIFTLAENGANGVMNWGHVKQVQIQIAAGDTGNQSADFNIDEIQLIGEGPPAGPGISLDVKIQPRIGVWPSDLNQITFPVNIDINGTVWTLSDSVITVQYSSASNGPKLLFYTDNEDSGAEYQYTGGDDCGGLIGEDQTTVAPVIWSLYDNRISETTNFSGAWGAAYYLLNSPLLPLNWEQSEWTNIYGPYIDGYWSYIVDVGNPTYTWNDVGKYCAVIAETNETGAFRKPQQAPLKGDPQLNPEFEDMGDWIHYKGPFGGWYIKDDFKSDMVQEIDGLADFVIYLGAGFKGKPIQNYKSNRFIIELIHY